ncbi:MAG: hypothetical protein Q8L63_03250, partial [Alphaproteobacteria bacterium]|nr:hypothetical protein [Alphaproteobacteria bacterium]
SVAKSSNPKSYDHARKELMLLSFTAHLESACCNIITMLRRPAVRQMSDNPQKKSLDADESL